MNEIWALDDVSFEIGPGEVLGVIGPNGVGKSTLLKILSRITRPTRGRAWVGGRVGSLLDEVGTGFHPELTGRENIYLNGAILGMTRSEIDRKFDEIVAFAGFEAFLDTPVKRYSTGMYTRLGFSVAAHLEPEILIVDEVLATGDAAFQQKSMGRMEMVAREGRTVLFVSHNMSAIKALCDRVIRLDRGRIADEGPPSDIVSRYLQSVSTSRQERRWEDAASAPGDHRIRLIRVRVRPAAGNPDDPITMRTPLVIEFVFKNHVEGANLVPYVRLTSPQGVVAFESCPVLEAGWRSRLFPAGTYEARCHIPGDLLIAGAYRVLVAVVKDEDNPLVELEDAVGFDVQDSPEVHEGWYGEMLGVVRPLLRWETRRIDEATGPDADMRARSENRPPTATSGR